MRIYQGRREEGPPERVSIYVFDDQTGRSYPLVENPAPHTTGLEWGYGGTGSHNTARAILDDHLGDFTPELASAFEREKIARQRHDRFDLTAAEIDDWLSSRPDER